MKLNFFPKKMKIEMIHPTRKQLLKWLKDIKKNFN